MTCHTYRHSYRPCNTFTEAEEKRFWRRYDEGYDIQTDDRYNAWLSFHGLTTNNASFDLGDSLFGSLDQGKLSL